MNDHLIGTVQGLSAAAAAAVLLAISAWSIAKRSASRLPLPPGPQPLPFVGNMLDIPREKAALVYSQLAQKYGACMSLWRWMTAEQKVIQGMLCISRRLVSILSF